MLSMRGFLALTALLMVLVVFSSCNPQSDNSSSEVDSNKGQSSNSSNGSAETVETPAIDDNSLFIVYSYDTNGKMETCGCSTRQLGGLSRRGTIIRDYETNYNRQMLMLDGGKILADATDFSKFKVTIIIKMMNQMNYSALNLGVYELVFDLAELSKWADQAKFPLVSSNVLTSSGKTNLVRPEALKNLGSLDATNEVEAGEFFREVKGDVHPGELDWLASPVIFVQLGNFRLGILGATKPEWADSLADGDLVALPIRDSFKQLVTKYADKADLWIAMIEADGTTIKSLMVALPEIQIWLSGNPRKGESIVGSMETTAGQHWQNIFQEGKYIGATSVNLQDGNYFITQNEIAVEDTIAERKDLLAIMVNEYRPELEKLFHLQTQPIGREFVYSVKCQRCHTEAFEIYRNSAHSRALETLQEKGQNWNPECVSCHIEFDELNDNQLSLQCSACHYRSWDNHIEDATANAANVKPLNEELGFDHCVKCHTPENSTEFAVKYKEYFAKIKHWDGPTVPGETENNSSD